MINPLPYILFLLTGKHREKVEVKFKKEAWTYNFFRVFELLFWRKMGQRPECSAGYIRDEKGFRTWIIHHTWENYLFHKEGQLRAFLKTVKLPRLVKVPIYLPQFAFLGMEVKKPIGYVYAIAYVGYGAYAGAAPQNTTYDDSAAFTLTVSGTNPFLIMGQNVQDGDYISAVKWDAAGVNETMTQLYKLDGGASGFYGFHYIYYRIAPSAGTTKRITATLSTNTFDRAGATVFSGVDQTSPLDSTGYGGHNENGTLNTASYTVAGSTCWIWTYFIQDNVLSTSAVQPSGYATDYGNDCAQSYSNATVSSGSNSLVWDTSGSNRSTQLACAFSTPASASNTTNFFQLKR